MRSSEDISMCSCDDFKIHMAMFKLLNTPYRVVGDKYGLMTMYLRVCSRVQVMCVNNDVNKTNHVK